MASDRWHWLRHLWGKWESYTQSYGLYVETPGGVQKEVSRSRIRQKRICAVCGKLQDVVVAELHQ